MSVERTVPSLHIYRQVTNISPERIADIQTQVLAEFGCRKRDLTFNTDLKANILAPGQLVGFYGSLGKIASNTEIDQLADHLADHLPDSFDQPTTAQTLPFSYSKYKHSRKPKSLSVAVENQTVRAEVESMNRLAYDFCEAQEIVPLDEAWPARPHISQVHLVQSYNGPLLQQIGTFLAERALLPEVIEFDQGSIEDCTYKTVYSDEMIAQNQL